MSTVNIGGIDYILNPVEDNMKTTIESHTSALNERAYRGTIASGTISAKGTVEVNITPSCFGFLILRIYKGYVEVLREWAILNVSGWASAQNLICSHDYLGDGDSGGFTFQFYNSDGQEKLKIISNHNSACNYFVSRLNI